MKRREFIAVTVGAVGAQKTPNPPKKFKVSVISPENCPQNHYQIPFVVMSVGLAIVNPNTGAYDDTTIGGADLHMCSQCFSVYGANIVKPW